MDVIWDDSDVTKLIDFTKRTFNDSDRLNVEKCVRNGTETQYLSDSCHTHSNEAHKSGFKRNEGDVVGQYLDELWASRTQMSIFLEDVIESASISYKNIVNKGLKDGLSLPSGSDCKIAYLSWKKALINHLQKHIIQQLRKDFTKKSSEGCFFSLGNEYNNFEPESINELMNKHFTVVNSFVGVDAMDSFRELEFMEYNGIFKKIDKSTVPFYENCYILWLKSSYLDQTKQKNTADILNKLSQIPYELTHKCKMLLQVISSVCVTYMQADQSSILKHTDGRYFSTGYRICRDDGVKLTCIYVPRAYSGASIELTVDGEVNKVSLKNDQLIILRAGVEYEIKKVAQKLFIFSSWITGPNE